MTFRSLAFRTFDQLGRARRVGHQPLEETFTDTNILELKDRHGSEIFTKTFNKREEGVNGADWEWWLTDAGSAQWLGLRVQAKVLNLASGDFPHLHYKSRKKYQSGKLRTECAKVGLIPLYCFYCHDEPGALTARGFCGSFYYTNESYGCSLATLSHVESLQKDGEKRDLASVLSRAFPWHCLVCCTGHGAGTLPQRAWAFLQGALDVNPSRRSRGPAVGPRESAPDYVRIILEGGSPERAPGNVAGILVIKEPKGD